ncbi:5'-3' exoribonuclease [Echinococcus granulosus]|uniref:5'-3' exoribonuclease n=1 Tax=Echinococcus granulosus TaxID=6210 RepID=W6U472_ECHGR|nr:5'-3' exoribonuclease [Echinococcus granulosus]EUB55903.1 5'-3' exoribonuclease [Echinococcus granulosus]
MPRMSTSFALALTLVFLLCLQTTAASLQNERNADNKGMSVEFHNNTLGNNVMDGGRSEIAFPFDLERIIDDWIFMGYLLGNDFIPHLPNMHIHAESTLYLWDTYHVVLPKLDGYINEFGTLNLERFHIFLSELSKLV